MCNFLEHHLSHLSASESRLELVLSQMELCWTGIFRVLITQMLLLVWLILWVQYGSSLTWGPGMRTFCILSILHRAHLFLVVELVKCILFLHLPWWLRLGVCSVSYSLHTFSFLVVHLVHFSLVLSLLVKPRVICSFLWCLLFLMFQFLSAPTHSVWGAMCRVLMQLGVVSCIYFHFYQHCFSYVTTVLGDDVVVLVAQLVEILNGFVWDVLVF